MWEGFPGLQQLGRKLGEGTALGSVQRHVAKDVLAFERLNELAEAIRVGVQVRAVDLMRVAGEHDLGALARPAHDCLDLMG